MKHPHQMGPLNGRYERRYGHKGLGLPGGVNTQLDPASVPPHQFLRLINGLLRGTGVEERGGCTLFNSTALHNANACTYPDDFGYSTPKRVWMITDGCPGESSSVGFSVVHYDTEQFPQNQRAAYYSGAASAVHLGGYGGVPHVGVDASLRRLNLVQVPFGTENITLAGTSQDVPLVTFTGFIIRFLVEFDGLLFIGLDNGAGASKIVTWDGRTWRDDLTGINAPIAAGLWRDSLVVYASGTNSIRIRSRGGSPGTWATVAPGAGTVIAHPGPNSIASYKDELYIASGGADIWNYDGTTLAVGRTIALSAIESVCDAFGYLYYGYLSTAPSARIGRYDNTTWTDNHKDFTSFWSRIGGLVYHKNNLVAAMNRVSFDGTVWASRGADTAGTWDAHSFGVSTNADINYAVVI